MSFDYIALLRALINRSRGQMALSKRLGCDFTLVVDEVAFDVNSGFLIAGSEVLEGYAFPSGVSTRLVQMDRTSTHGF